MKRFGLTDKGKIRKEIALEHLPLLFRKKGSVQIVQKRKGKIFFKHNFPPLTVNIFSLHLTYYTKIIAFVKRKVKKSKKITDTP